ncbi:hypothetical protein D3C81_1269750 [compost metagenome]
MTSPTVSSTTKVSRYCTSLTANESRGGTKKKSNAPTDSTEASAAGPRPCRSATPTTAARNSMAMLTISNQGRATVESSVAPAHQTTDQT